MTTVDQETWDRLRLLHEPSGLWCGVCLEAGSMDSEHQRWPCDTAELLFTVVEIVAWQAAVELDRQRAAEVAAAAAQERAEVERAKLDAIREHDPEGYWNLVQLVTRSEESARALRAVWDREIIFQSTPILRYESLRHRDGSEDTRLRTGRYAAQEARDDDG